MKVLIIDKMHDSIVPLLKDLGCDADYEPQIKREQILNKLNDYEGLIVRSKTQIDEELLSKGPHLKFVARAGAGVDKVDLEAMSKYGVELINAPEGNRDAVAEHTMGMILSLFNKLNIADRQIRNGVWDREANRGVELMGKTVGLLGFGYMGQAVAKRLESFDCNVIAFDLRKEPTENIKHGAQLVNFHEFQKEVEVLSIHIPMNTHNDQLIDSDYLNGFKKLEYIINTARGEVMNLSDIIHYLENKRLKGLALDVLPNEKIAEWTEKEHSKYKKLFQYEQVLLSPHVAGWTYESYEKINKVLINKIKKLLN